ncbi:MAG: PEGA domain-containing protein [Polyangiaceae bacterium]|nr:PEGA domain-containing protein [Polyangiaceae bacterium]
MRQRAFIAAALVAMSFGTSARADDTARAKELYEMGNKLYDEQKWAEAEAAYQSAWNLRQSHDLAGNLGAVEMQLGQYRDAAEHLSYAYDGFPAGGKPEVRAALAKSIEEAKQHIGVLRIKTNVIGARLYVDGKLVGQSPLEKGVFVDVGQRVIEGRMDGHDDVLRTVVVAKGSTQDLDLQLVPKVGGASAGGNAKRTVIIAVGAGLAAAGLGVGIGFWAAGSGKTSDAEGIRGGLKVGDCPGTTPEIIAKCTSLKSTLEDHDTYVNVGTGMFVTGLILGAGTVGYAVMTRKKSSTMGFEMTPVVAPTFAGVSLSGRF